MIWALNEIGRQAARAIEWLIEAVEGPPEGCGIDEDLGAVPPGPRLRDLVLVVRGITLDHPHGHPETRLDDAFRVIAGRSWPEWMEIAAEADAALAARRAVR